jgi:hypothetical protein
VRRTELAGERDIDRFCLPTVPPAPISIKTTESVAARVRRLALEAHVCGPPASSTSQARTKA